MTPGVPVAKGPARSIRSTPWFHSGHRVTSSRTAKTASGPAAVSTLCSYFHIARTSIKNVHILYARLSSVIRQESDCQQSRLWKIRMSRERRRSREMGAGGSW